MPYWNLWVMIEPSMVRTVLEAPCSKAVEKVPSPKYPRAEHLDMFRLCRNYFIYRIIACNGQRSGIIPNMTPSSFERTRQKKGGVVMTESRHFILLLHFIKEKVFTIRFKFTIYFQIKKYKTDFVVPAVIALPDPLPSQRICAEFSANGQVPAEVWSCSYVSDIHVSEREGPHISAGAPHAKRGQQGHKQSLAESPWERVQGERNDAAKIHRNPCKAVNPLARDVLATRTSHRASTADRYYNLPNQQYMALPVPSLISETMSH